ncbi:hypothetical protein SUGI_0134080 [Cryptomeria japonica]|nr:hypothetical protein SUGI_0134080 [Cryptomeria japonica]
MEFLSGIGSGIINNLWKPAFEEIKHLTSLGDDAERLHQQIDRVKGTVDDINSRLKRRARQPLPALRNWLNTQERILKYAQEVFGQYEQNKQRRLCWCCPHCILIPKSSQKIRKSLADIDDLLKMKDLDIPKNGELGEPLVTLVHPTDSELVGKIVHEKLLELETWLLEDDSVRVVGVYGMPGVGKTAVLKQINNNGKVVKFFTPMIWVTVSRDSDISALQRRICESIELPWQSGWNIDEAAGALHSVFKERRLLLILDDVWKSIDVSNLGISLSDNKTKVVLTSRDKEVCKGMKTDKMIGIKHLSDEEGWELFCRGAFVAGKDQKMDIEIEHFARSIAKECEGHPLAIKTLARTMPQLQDSSASEWKYILNQLKATDPLFYRIHEKILRDLFNPLKHSYDALRTDELKLCFLYLAAYREDELIDADQLI